ncbi:MAG: hypothetical protein U0228_26660 [Myxococcaceae bacterium]
MLSLLALTLIFGAAEVSTEQKDPDPPALRLQLTALGGASVFDVEPSLPKGGSRGPVAGAAVSVRATRSPFTNGGGKFGILLTLQGLFEPLAQRLDWGGVASMTVTLLRLVITTGIGYGLSSLSGEAPRHSIVLRSGLALPLGPFFLSVVLDANFRPGTNGRTMQLLAGVAYEFELARLFEN